MEYGVSSREFYYEEFAEEAFHQGFNGAHAETENFEVAPEDDIPY